MKQKGTSIVGWGKNRQVVDWYITPPQTTESLMKREKFEGIVWECASGDGSMAKVLSKYNAVIASDLRTDDKVYGHKGIDFLKNPQRFEADNIITNPPFRYGKEFVELALKNPRIKKVAMIFKISFLEGIGRYNFFKSTPLKKVLVFCRRQPINNASREIKNSGLIAFCWFIWDKDYVGEPTIGWINDKLCRDKFQTKLNKPKVNTPSLSKKNTKENGFPPTPKGMGIQPTIL